MLFETFETVENDFFFISFTLELFDVLPFLAAESGSVEVLVSFSDVVWPSSDGALPEFACDTEVPVVRSNTCF